jgi:hypothetical protein
LAAHWCAGDVFVKKIFLFLLLAACTNEIEARRVLEMQNISNVKMTGYQLFACSDDDWYHTGFVGTRDGRERDAAGVSLG